MLLDSAPLLVSRYYLPGSCLQLEKVDGQVSPLSAPSAVGLRPVGISYCWLTSYPTMSQFDTGLRVSGSWISDGLAGQCWLVKL